MNLRCFSKGSHDGIWQNGITRRYFRDAPRFSWDKSGHYCFSRDAPRLSRDKSSHSRFSWHILVTLNSLEINLITLISLGMRLVFSTFSWDKSDYSRFSWDAPRFYWDTSGYSCFSQNMSISLETNLATLSFPRDKPRFSRDESCFSRCVTFIARWDSFFSRLTLPRPTIQVRHTLLHSDLQSETHL